MTTNYGTGVIVLDDTSDDVLTGKFMVARVVFLSPTSSGRMTVSDKNGQIVAAAVVNNTNKPTVSVDVYHNVAGLQLTETVSGGEAHVYLKEW